MQLVRKISPRTVWGTKTDVLELVLSDKTKEHPLFRVFGIAIGTRKGQSKPEGEGGKSSEWTALLGNFEAHNLQSGEVFQSGQCFLPNYITDLVAGKLTEDTTSVRFAFEITAAFDEASATTYSYGGSPLLPTEQNDPLKELVSSVPEPMKAIAGKK